MEQGCLGNEPIFNTGPRAKGSKSYNYSILSVSVGILLCVF